MVRTFFLKFDNSATVHFEKNNCLKVTKHGERTVNSEQSVSVCFYEYHNHITIMIDIIEVNSLQTLQEFFKQGIDTLDR